jgi:hypothetical protein
VQEAAKYSQRVVQVGDVSCSIDHIQATAVELAGQNMT